MDLRLKNNMIPIIVITIGLILLCIFGFITYLYVNKYSAQKPGAKKVQSPIKTSPQTVLHFPTQDEIKAVESLVTIYGTVTSINNKSVVISSGNTPVTLAIASSSNLYLDYTNTKAVLSDFKPGQKVSVVYDKNTMVIKNIWKQ